MAFGPRLSCLMSFAFPFFDLYFSARQADQLSSIGDAARRLRTRFQREREKKKHIDIPPIIRRWGKDKNKFRIRNYLKSLVRIHTPSGGR